MVQRACCQLMARPNEAVHCWCEHHASATHCTHQQDSKQILNSLVGAVACAKKTEQRVAASAKQRATLVSPHVRMRMHALNMPHASRCSLEVLAAALGFGVAHVRRQHVCAQHRQHPLFSPYAHVRMHALKGLACRARVSPASSPCSGEACVAAPGRSRRSDSRAAAPVLFVHAHTLIWEV